MFPIKDHNPSEKTPYVTFAIIAANLVVFLSYWSLLADEASLSVFFNRWALIPHRIVGGNGQIRLLTSMFLHAGLWHLAGNMLFLWIFGDNLEDQLGHLEFLLFYLTCGIGAGLAHLASDPGSTIPAVGASGAIAGVMGGYLLLFPRARVDVVLILIIFFQSVHGSRVGNAGLLVWFAIVQQPHHQCHQRRCRILGACGWFCDRIC